MTEEFRQNKDILNKHLEFVLEYNKKVNLTSIDSYDAGILLHIEDSLAALPEILQAAPGLMADIGSGGGYPGIPLAIASGRKTILIESINKKATALTEFIKQEGLDQQISVLALRSEAAALQQPKQFAVVTARAVSELPVLVELASPLLEPGGMLVALKGSPSADEIMRGKKAAELSGMEPFAVRQFTLSDNQTTRTIVSFKKVSEPVITLPRRPGIAVKRPLA